MRRTRPEARRPPWQVVAAHGPAVRRWIVAATFVAATLVFVRPLNDPFNVPKLSVLVVGVGLSAAVRVLELRAGFHSDTRRMLLLAAFVMVPLLAAWTFSDYRGWALFGEYGRFQGLAPYALVVALGVFAVDGFRDHTRMLAWCVMAAGAGVAAYALIQLVGLDPFAWSLPGGTRETALSTLGNPDFAGAFLAICVPVGVVLTLREKTAFRLARLLTIGMLAALVATQSQAAMLAAAGGALLAVGLLSDARAWRTGAALGWLACALAAVGAVVVTMMGVRSELLATATARGYLWQAAGRMAVSAPVLGRGPNAFAQEGVTFRSPEEVDQDQKLYGSTRWPADDPHSAPLAFLTSAGFVGLAGWLLVFASLGRDAVRSLGRDALQAGFLGAVGAYLVQSLVTVDELSLRMALWIVVAGAVVARPGAADDASSRARRVPPWVRVCSVGAALALAGAAGWWGIAAVMADRRVQAGRALFEAAHVDDGIESLTSAIAFRDEARYRSIYGSLLGDVAFSNVSRRSEYVSRMRGAYAYLDTVPDLPSRLTYAGSLVALRAADTGYAREAIEQYERAIEIDPLNPAIRLSAFDVLIELHDFDEALAFVRPCTRYDLPAFEPCWGAAALALAQLGQEADALKALDHVGAQDPRALAARRVLESG